MNSFLSFLSNVKVEDVTPSAARSNNAKKQRNPNPAFLGFRIWQDGAVYPSQALVDRFNLEYPNATVSVVKTKDGKDKNVMTVVGNPGNGIDVIDTRKWGQIKTQQDFIAVAFSPKDSPKIDMFGLTRYTDSGAPATSVMEQGVSTFGKKTLLPLIEDLYNVVPNEEGFIDMEVITPEAGGVNLRSTNGIELLPKVVSRGEQAGKPDYTRRENVDIFGLAPVVAEAAPVNAVIADDEVEEDSAKLFVEDGVEAQA